MKINKIKIYVKLSILLLGILLVLTNCLDDKITNADDEYENTNPVQVSKLTLEEFNQNDELKQELLKFEKQLDISKDNPKNKNGVLSKVISTDNSFSILTDEIIKVETDSTEAYTFRIETPTNPKSKFENFIIEKNADNIYNFYIFRYQETMELGSGEIINTLSRELLDPNIINLNDFNNYLGKMIYAGYDETTECLYTINYSEDCTCEYLQIIWCKEGGGTGGVSNSESSGSSGNSGDNGNTGSNSSSSGNSDNNPHSNGSSSSSSSTSSTVGVLPPFASNNCDNLNNLTKNSEIKTKFYQLGVHSNDTGASGENEKGFKIQKNPNNNKFTSTDIQTGSDNGLDHHVNLIPSSYTIAAIHSHPPSGVYSMFSAQDILFLARMANTIELPTSSNNIEPVNITIFLIVYGQTFALSFDNPQAVQNLKDIYNDKKKRQNFIDKLESDYEKDNNIMTGETSTIYDQQNRLLTFLNNYNLNISMYEATYTNNIIDGWEKFKDNGTKEPCN